MGRRSKFIDKIQILKDISRFYLDPFSSLYLHRDNKLLKKYGTNKIYEESPKLQVLQKTGEHWFE